MICGLHNLFKFVFWLCGIFGPGPKAKFPISLSKHISLTPWLLYISNHHSAQKFLSIWKLVELKMFDFSDLTRTGITWLLYSSTHHSPQKVLSAWKLVELKMLDFSDRTRTGISIFTSAPLTSYSHSYYIVFTDFYEAHFLSLSFFTIHYPGRL